jgi:hypothetical protein
MSKQPKPLPKFANEAEERSFWESHGSSEYMDWSKAQCIVLPNLKPTTKTNFLATAAALIGLDKSAANSRDVPYQSLIKVWLQEKLHSN